jgi:hypothetical protein
MPTRRFFTTGTSSGSIFIYGGPGVDVKITTPSSVSVKFLNFSLPSRKILCIGQSSPQAFTLEDLTFELVYPR